MVFRRDPSKGLFVYEPRRFVFWPSDEKRIFWNQHDGLGSDCACFHPILLKPLKNKRKKFLVWVELNGTIGSLESYRDSVPSKASAIGA